MSCTGMMLAAVLAAVPLAVPALAVESSYLSVSSGSYYGPMVLEVTVDDPVFANRGSSEPLVFFDGVKLAMTQTVDGVWRAYVAYAGFAVRADDLAAVPGTGLDFGRWCDSAGFAAGFDPRVIVLASSAECDDKIGTIGVVDDAGEAIGGAGRDHWPFIQAFDVQEGMVWVEYRDALLPIRFDSGLPYESVVEFDRDSYLFGVPVHIKIHDVMLNMDPTARDSWTFNYDGSVARNLFDSEGRLAGAAAGADPGLLYHDVGAMSDIGFGGASGGKFGLYAAMGEYGDPVVRPNSLQESGNDTPSRHVSMTILETGPNTGIFANTDRFGRSNIATPPDTGIGPDHLVIEYYAEYVRDVGQGTAAFGQGVESGVEPAVRAEPEPEPQVPMFYGTIYRQQVFEDPSVTDVAGNALDTARVGQQVLISSDIRFGVDEYTEFAHVIQIQDEEGETVHLSWMSGTLAPGQDMESSQSWIPGRPGTHTVTIFLWNAIDDPTPLRPPLETVVHVAD